MNQVSVDIGHNSRLPAFAPFLDRLAELHQADEGQSFDYTDPEGNKAARSHIHSLRLVKGEIERVRKKEKAESLEYGRRVDEQAKAITAEVEAMIERHETPIKEIEQREKDRVAAHEKALAELESAGQFTTENWQSLSLDAMRDRLAEVEKLEGRDWEEFANRALYAAKAAGAMIREAIARREAFDREQAEGARQRAEAEAKAQAEREERIRQEAAAKAQAEAEAKALAERQAAATREADLKAAAERAEREKAEAEERAKRAAAETEERLRREAEAKAKQEAEAAAKREASKRHVAGIHRTARDAFVANGLPEDQAQLAVTLIAKRLIPNVTIQY